MCNAVMLAQESNTCIGTYMCCNASIKTRDGISLLCNINKRNKSMD